MNRKIWRWLALFVFGLMIIGTGTPAAAMAAANCQSLTSSVSSDKNYQVFTAMATAAAGDVIQGYTFDFGDNQSYSFTYGSDNDRGQATVTHIYSRDGGYTATVTVQTAAANGRIQNISSPACSTHVAIGPQQAGALVNTGPGNAILLSLYAGVAAGTAHRNRCRFKRFLPGR